MWRRMLPAEIFALCHARETGVLVLRDGARKKKVYIVDGNIECISSTDKNELLGESLVASGQVLRMELEMALALLPRFGGRLGDALVGLGVLRPVELFRAMHTQTQNRFASMFAWRRGEIMFAQGARSQEETFPLGVDPAELVARGIRESYSDDELASLFETSRENILRGTSRNMPQRMPEPELLVLREATARATTLSRLTATLTKRVDPGTVLRAVFIGLSLGVLTCEGWEPRRLAR